MKKYSFLTEIQKIEILTSYSKETPTRKIATQLNLPKSTIHNFIQRFKRKGTIANIKPSGRNFILTAQLRRKILDLLRRKPTLTIRQVKEKTGVGCSERTYQQIFKEGRT